MGTFIFWGRVGKTPKYHGKVGGALWTEFVTNARHGHGECWLIDGANVADARARIEGAAPTSVAGVFASGPGAAAALRTLNVQVIGA